MFTKENSVHIFPLEPGLSAEEVHRRACATRKVIARAERALCFVLIPNL